MEVVSVVTFLLTEMCTLMMVDVHMVTLLYRCSPTTMVMYTSYTITDTDTLSTVKITLRIITVGTCMVRTQ